MPPDLTWIDLCDPTEDELRAALPIDIQDFTFARLLEAAREEPRPRLEEQGNYVFGVLAFPEQTDHGTVFQEVDIIAAADALVTIRKTPANHVACEFTEARNAALRNAASAGMCLYLLVDEIAERFLDIVDGYDDAIDELEDRVTEWPSQEIRQRIGDIRHDLLHTRRIVAPTRDAARAVLDDRVEIEEGDTLFPREVELRFADAYDKLLRATDGLDLSRDLLAGVRDYHQSEIANDQNDVMKRLTVIASVLLVPTFIVGLYGQNLRGVPEFRWRYGYAFSWFLIISATVFQLWFYRRKKWI